MFLFFYADSIYQGVYAQPEFYLVCPLMQFARELAFNNAVEERARVRGETGVIDFFYYD